MPNHLISVLGWTGIAWFGIYSGLTRSNQGQMGWASFNFLTTALALLNILPLLK